jgi:DnaJ-class molecular chaperone
MEPKKTIYLSSEIAVCRNCKGEGVVAKKQPYPYSREGEKLFVCEVCNGAGMVRIRREVLTEIKPHYPNIKHIVPDE